MKTKYLNICLLVSGGLLSGCVIEPNGQMAFQIPVIAVQPVAPEPVIVSDAPVPETYVWDGEENIGIVGDQYYYLGPGNVWIVCEPFRLERFHGWERYHPGWRDHAIRNDIHRGGHDGGRPPNKTKDKGTKAPPKKKP